MNRRDLFTRLAAITAAVTLAPAVKAEAAPDDESFVPFYEDGSIRVMAPKGTHLKIELTAADWGNESRTPPDREYGNAIADARAEGYTRGWDVRDANAESKALRVDFRSCEDASEPPELPQARALLDRHDRNWMLTFAEFKENAGL